MTPWTFHNPVDVRAGNGALAQLPRLVGARDALLIAFPEAEALGLVGRVRELLGDRLVAVETDIRPNPDLCWLAPLYERLWREHRDARCVVALGGGSSIDCAKAMLTATPSGRFDELLDHLVDPKAAPLSADAPHRALIAVPTTAGTGSEVTPWATLWDAARGRKHSLHLPWTWPEAAIVDPSLMVSLPLGATLASGLDALSHALEALSPALMDEQDTYRIEVLQVTDIEPYQQALDGFLKVLRDNGIAAGRNLTVNRVKIDFDVEKGGFWDRFRVLLRIRDEAQRIAHARPNLVLTIGTPATRYARGILDDAHIPVVFTAVANPQEAGCASLTDAGPGATGATLYTDMAQSLKVVKEIFPAVHRIGMVHTDDENGIAHVEAVRATARDMGVTVSTRQVGKNDSIIPALKQLVDDGRGAEMFAVPLDTYYGLRHYEPARDLGDFGAERRIPVVSLALVRMPGAMLYVGADFNAVGRLSGVQAAKILKRRVKPDILPILRQEAPTVLLDPQRAAALNVALPASVLERKAEVQGGFWRIGAAPQ